jgi:hypothetical protein
MTRSSTRSLIAPRWLAMLTLLLAIVVGAAVDAPTFTGGAATAKDNGHGDNSGPGNGNDAKKKDKDDSGKGKAKNKKKPKDDEGPETVQVVVVQPAVDVRVTVGCFADPERGQSTCVFAGVATTGGATVAGIAVPEGTICAPVVAGDFARSDGDAAGDAPTLSSDATVTSWYAVGAGYRGPAFVSKNRPDVVILVFDGAVTTGGSTTYWVRTASGVAAAAGPALHCRPAAQTGADVAADAHGAIVIQAFACPNDAAPVAESERDWFAVCTQPAFGATFELTALDGDNAGWQRRETADAGGVLRAADLTPGRYRIVQIGANWCHAESDRVDAGGNVLVKAGERASVWIFDCEGAASPTPTPVST